MSPNSRPQASFQRRLVNFSLTLIGALCVTALIAGFALWSLTVPAISGRLSYDTKYLADRMAQALEVTLAAEDQDSAKALTSSLTADPDFGGVAVFLADGRLLHGHPALFEAIARDVQKQPAATPNWGPGRIAAWKPVELEGTRLGSIVIAYSTSRLDRLNQWMYGFTVFILLFLVWSTWYSIRFDRRFVAPLRRIIDFARQMGEGQLQTRLDESGATAETQALLDELNRMAGEIQTQHEELDEARRSAEEVSQLKTRFLANMSHEMRTPLNGVIGNAELLLNSPLKPRVRQDLKVIHASATGLMDIIADILDIAKIESGHLSVESIETDLSEVFHTSLYAVVVPAKRKGIRVRVELSPDVPVRIVSDPIRLRQVLMNLLSNAVKFTQNGQVALRIGIVGDQLEVSVQDDGIGMRPDQVESIFEAFRQADVSTTRRFGGTGLGLAISRSLIELLGGSVHVDSEPGVGSTFTIRLPLTPAPSDRQLPDGLRCSVLGPTPWANNIAERLKRLGAAMSPPETATALIVCGESNEELAPVRSLLERVRKDDMRVVGVVQPDRIGEDCPLLTLGLDALLSEPAFGDDILARRAATDDVVVPASPERSDGLSILVAEDNIVNQRVVQRMLEQLGHLPKIVGNGQHAVEAVTDKDADFDVVLMDLQMPVMDGYEATRKIRAAGRGVPIVALTADAMAGAMSTCIEVGMNGYLSKPLRMPSLQKELARVLDDPTGQPTDSLVLSGR